MKGTADFTMNLTVLIANDKDFFDITDVIPHLLGHWKKEGIDGSFSTAIRALMKVDNCTQMYVAKSWEEAVEAMMLDREGI